MNVKCFFGVHNWEEDCEQCSICGKQRKEAHDWNDNCEQCSICRTTRENLHVGDGCKCTKCGTIKNSNHHWQNDNVCTQCGRTRNEAIHIDCLDAVIKVSTEILITDLGDIAGSVTVLLHGADSEENRNHEQAMDNKKRAIVQKYYKQVADKWEISTESLDPYIRSIVEKETPEDGIPDNQELIDFLRSHTNPQPHAEGVISIKSPASPKSELEAFEELELEDFEEFEDLEGKTAEELVDEIYAMIDGDDHEPELNEYDLRTEEEKQLIARAHAGDINDESLVDKLLTIDEGSYMSDYSATEGICGVDCTYPNPKLIQEGDLLICPNCQRSCKKSDYNEESRHKVVVEIGKTLAERGGVELMQTVAYRFSTRGGKAYNLSAAWHGIGGWLN